MQLSENALFTLKKRYLIKNADGMETPEQMFRRVADAISVAEKPEKRRHWADKFYRMMANLEFLPNSPTLMNAGTPNGQLAACFVLPVPDSMEGIFSAIRNAAMVHKSGGGTGFSFSRLRPSGSRVGSTGGVASGPISFMKIFNTATEQVKQGGKRRGANMGILRVDHPDIIEFIKAKETESELNNFNLSVGLTSSFMDAVENDAEYELIDPYLRKPAGKKKAREVFDLLVDRAWQSGEPGIVFLDRINQSHSLKGQEEIEATNPCGEQPLLPYEACNLGSLNLAAFVRLSGRLDACRLEAAARDAIRFLDDVVSVSVYPLPEISQKVRENRKIGLGVMGFADALFKMGIPYDSEEGLETGRQIMALIQTCAKEESSSLARERGNFPAWKNSIYRDESCEMRNATRTTIAPTGSLSIIANCSSGIEPLFALAFERRILDGERLVEFNPVLLEKLRELGLDNDDIRQKIIEKGNLAGISEIPDKVKRIFRTASEIGPEWHLRMQAAFQKSVDNAVSKTVNLPNSATRDDIRRIYELAWQLGCKGVTVYRDGSRQSQPLVVAKKSDDAAKAGMAARPDMLSGRTFKIRTGLGTMYLTINELDGKPFEVFATLGKSGRSTMAKAEAVGRLVSLALRHGVPVCDIVAQIKGIGGEHPVLRQKGLLLSIPDAIGCVLESLYLDGKGKSEPALCGAGSCPDCGGELKREEGCVICHACGFSKCG